MYLDPWLLLAILTVVVWLCVGSARLLRRTTHQLNQRTAELDAREALCRKREQTIADRMDATGERRRGRR